MWHSAFVEPMNSPFCSEGKQGYRASCILTLSFFFFVWFKQLVKDLKAPDSWGHPKKSALGHKQWQRKQLQRINRVT